MVQTQLSTFGETISWRVLCLRYCHWFHNIIKIHQTQQLLTNFSVLDILTILTARDKSICDSREFIQYESDTYQQVLESELAPRPGDLQSLDVSVNAKGKIAWWQYLLNNSLPRVVGTKDTCKVQNKLHYYHFRGGEWIECIFFNQFVHHQWLIVASASLLQYYMTPTYKFHAPTR